MMQPQQPWVLQRWRRVVASLRDRFSLLEDKADDIQIDQTLRASVVMRGTNLWVLMFAILIASIGLNVNSTAVIIGAMLISPLMGPIMGAGYGVGISDFALIRKSLKNLGIATLLALLTSTVYFAISPLTSAQSELLARTNPTIWDVLIAFFGGMAGIVAATRKEKSNAIPGVAIATALMPPLCTAGYGIATFNIEFFLGAFYLFSINCVFIALASAVTTRAFHVTEKHFVNARVAQRVHFYLGALVMLTVIPSLYLAYQMVGYEIYRSRATQFVHDKLEFDRSHVVSYKIMPESRRIEVTLVGDVVEQTALALATNALPQAGLQGTALKVFQTGEQKVDVGALRSSLLGELFKESRDANDAKEKTIATLQSELSVRNETRTRLRTVPEELHALYPRIWELVLMQAPAWNADTGWNTQDALVVSINTEVPLTKRDQLRIEQWLMLRNQVKSVELVVKVMRKPAVQKLPARR
jgi:uncharacterized hydrophobic protein (TIGR00271 family)